MEYIYIGKITSTHGIKGELKIKSDFKYKNLVFKKNNKLYVGNKHNEEIINNYRVHKQYDMVLFNNYNDINEVLKYKGANVYFNKEDLNFSDKEYLDEDLIGLDIICNNEIIGKVIDIVDSGNGNILIKLEKFYIPKKDNFIEKIDFDNSKIYVKNIEGLII